MKLREHDPEVLAIVAETIADWRKRKNATCQTCGGCRVEALAWCGADHWKPVPCSECSGGRPEET